MKNEQNGIGSPTCNGRRRWGTRECCKVVRRRKNQLKFLHASHLTLIRYIQSSTNSYIFFSSCSIRIKGITQSSSKTTTICSQMCTFQTDKGNINIKYSYGLQLGLSNLYYNRWMCKRQGDRAKVRARERERVELIVLHMLCRNSDANKQIPTYICPKKWQWTSIK